MAKFKKVFVVGCGFFLIALFIAALYGFGYLQTLTEQLPSPDKPFGKKNAASEIYDRNGKLLYRVYGNENRDPVIMADVPQLMKWSILAAEDIDFYNHSGVDVVGVVRCGIMNIAKTSSCGGSTITQQLIKQTALSLERSYERKIKEVILALQIEQQRNKDEILEMYLNVIPEGSNIYGLKSASREYFGKELKDLNLAEMAILASIPQDPNNLSPTRSSNSESKEKVKIRQSYVLDQMDKYFDLINEEIRKSTGVENTLTREMITEARNYELVYTTAKKRDELKAPHFVFYVEKLLQERGYNNGEPFSLESLENNGYKIYTTLDLDYQEIAEEQVREGVDVYGKKYGADNAALVALKPATGEIMALVGSKDYFGESTPAGCSGTSCKFNPEVNIMDTLQSYGSSMKPMVYYYAIEKGLIHAGSIIPDVRIKIGNYQPKNFGSVFTYFKTAREHLRNSQNIPPIYMLDQLGVDNFIAEMKKWGYTTLTDPRGYGPSIAVGGADIKLIEHAQAYGVLANQGTLVQHEVVLKIIDRDGTVVYEYQPKGEQVADGRAAFIVNDILNANKGGPGLNAANGGNEYKGWDKRDISGKTGTSEDGKETLFCTYTPELVVVGWLGNNNNEPMSTSVSGFGSARPWISEFMLRVGNTFPGTPFVKPAGVVSKGACDGDACEGYGGDYGLVDVNPPAYVTVKPYTVCKDDPTRLARKIDIDMGMATTINVKTYKMPDTKLQGQLDAFVASNAQWGGVEPKEYCNISRNPSGGTEPWVALTSPANGAVVTGGSVAVQFNAFTSNAGATVSRVDISLDGGGTIASATTLPYSTTLSLGGLTPGVHTLTFKVHDSSGSTGTSSVKIEVLGAITITSPGGNKLDAKTAATIKYSYSGGQAFEAVSLTVSGVVTGTCTAGVTGTCTFTTPDVGDFEVKVVGTRKGTSLTSNALSLKAE